MTPFERDFADLHSALPRPTYRRRPAARIEIIDHAEVRRGHAVAKVQSGAAWAAMLVVGLFWALVLSGVVGAMIVVAWAFGSAALGL